MWRMHRLINLQVTYKSAQADGTLAHKVMNWRSSEHPSLSKIDLLPKKYADNLVNMHWRFLTPCIFSGTAISQAIESPGTKSCKHLAFRTCTCSLVIHRCRAFISGRLLGKAGAPIGHRLLGDVGGKANVPKTSLHDLTPVMITGCPACMHLAWKWLVWHCPTDLINRAICAYNSI